MVKLVEVKECLLLAVGAAVAAHSLGEFVIYLVQVEFGHVIWHKLELGYIE